METGFFPDTEVVDTYEKNNFYIEVLWLVEHRYGSDLSPDARVVREFRGC